MLILPRAVFLHVPKTGGSWVRSAIRAAGCRAEEFVVEGDIHGDLSYCPHPERFKFAFVRNPLALYRSYWRYKIGSGWDPLNPFDIDCAADAFPRFIENVVTRHPAWCSSMFEDYVGSAASPIDFIGRFESLADDLIRALRLTGEGFSESALRATPPVNVSQAYAAVWTPELIDSVVRSETRAFTRFGYDASVESLSETG